MTRRRWPCHGGHLGEHRRKHCMKVSGEHRLQEYLFIVILTCPSLILCSYLRVWTWSQKVILAMTSGTSMVLTGCIVHGYGIFLYLVDEGMPTGASWTIEVVSQLKVKLKVVSQLKKTWPQSTWMSKTSKAMRSIDKAFTIARANNRTFPAELLVTTGGGEYQSVWSMLPNTWWGKQYIMYIYIIYILF